MGPNQDLKFSIIIAAPEPGAAEKALAGLTGIKYPAENWEVFLALGKRPSLQRNLAAREAGGDILLFLDNDSVAAPDLLRRLADPFDDEKTAVVGGPNLAPHDDDGLPRAFDALHSSPFYSGWTLKRWSAVGKGPGKAREGDLILCNLAFRKEVFLEMDGFDEALYPNEENDLMARIAKKGFNLVYVPEAAIFRSREGSKGEFLLKQIFYGSGRGRQMWRRTLSSSIPYLLPLAGAGLALGALGGMTRERRRGRVGIGTAITALALGGYLGVGGLWHRRFITRRLGLPFTAWTGVEGMAPIGHAAYGLGLLRGILTGHSLNDHSLRADGEVNIEKVKAFGKPYVGAR